MSVAGNRRSEINPRYQGRSSKTYNAGGGFVSGRTGGPLSFSKFVTTVDFGGFSKTGVCHRFEGARGSTGISVLRIADPRQPASRSRRNECLPSETSGIHGELSEWGRRRISSARSSGRCSRSSRACSTTCPRPEPPWPQAPVGPVPVGVSHVGIK